MRKTQTLQLASLAFILAVSFLAKAEEAERDPASIKEEKSTYALCKNGSAVRTLRIDLKGRSCKATYTKEGVDKMVGKSATPDVCYTIFDKIRKNLEAGNWKCKDIKQDRISMSLDEG